LGTWYCRWEKDRYGSGRLWSRAKVRSYSEPLGTRLTQAPLTRVDCSLLSPSDFASISRPDYLKSHPRDIGEQQGRDPHKMAAATLLSPASTYNNHNHALPPYAQAPAPHSSSLSSIMTQNGPRRESNDSEATTQRQSLPSISDIFQHVKSSPYSPTTPTTLNSSQSHPPPPFSNSTGPPRIEPQENRLGGYPHDDKYSRYPPRVEGAPMGHANSSYGYGARKRKPSRA
jgi:hypothetical protein